MDTNIFLWDLAVVTFSGPTDPPKATPDVLDLAPGETKLVTVEVHDDVRNPLTSACQVTFSSNSSDVEVEGSSFAVRHIPDGHSFNQLVEGLTQFTFSVRASAHALFQTYTLKASVGGSGVLDCPNGNFTSSVVSGTVLGPQPTPTSVPPTPTP
ncbi:MAG: hypothetical protein HY270_03050 [Deltaproteobacteria bacterium]|nr:hypothetical protein [Deltaproteobacteria bacterium]